MPVVEHNGVWWTWPDGLRPIEALRRGLVFWWRLGESAWQRLSGGTNGGAGTGDGMYSVGEITYEIHPEGYWGPEWGDRRPPGLPADQRPCSARYAARPYLERLAEQLVPGDVMFRQALLALAEKESGMEFGRPANSYCTTTEGNDYCENPTSAYGLFNPNLRSCRGTADTHSYFYPETATQDAWASLGISLDWVREAYPYQWPLEAELLIYPARYAAYYRWARRQGIEPAFAAAGLLVYHSSSSRMRPYIARAREVGGARAWAELATIIDKPQSKIDGWTRRLRNWGVFAD